MMDGSQGGSNSPAPFLVKTYEMVDDELSNSIVSWSDNGESFVVWNPPEFARDLLPKYFKHNNFSSFVRQLNTYGFRKIDPEQWEFANEEFIRGQRHLLKNIYRRKPIHSHSTQKNAAVPLTDSEREEYEKEIERLKRDNTLLQTDLERHKEENQAYEFGMKSLGQRLVEIDQRQKQLVTFFSQQLDKREFTATYMQQAETHNKKRRLFVSSGEDHQYTCSGQTINSEVIKKLDSSIGFWENFLQDINKMPVEDIYEFGVLPQQSPVIISEMNIRQSSPQSHLSSSPSREIRSSLELSSPATSSVCIDVDSRLKSSGTNVNSSPDDIVDVVPSRNRVEGTTTRAVPLGANDVFWQQFLTETPGSNDAQEVQSERKESECRRNGSEDQQRPWWNVDSLAKEMMHLTPAKTT